MFCGRCLIRRHLYLFLLLLHRLEVGLEICLHQPGVVGARPQHVVRSFLHPLQVGLLDALQLDDLLIQRQDLGSREMTVFT